MRLLIVGVFALLFTGYYWLDLGQYLSLEAIQNSLQTLQTYVDSHLVLASLIFVSAYIVITAASLPGALWMTLLGGALFGISLGLVLVSFSSVVGATVAAVCSRYLFRDVLSKRYPQLMREVQSGIEKSGWRYLLFVRLVPIFPFFLVNIGFGLTSMPWRQYILVSWLGMLPGTAIYVNAGKTLASLESTSDILSGPMLAALVLVAALSFVPQWITRISAERKLYAPFTKPKNFDYNIAVIGAGAAGLVTSNIAAHMKAKTLLIEAGAMGGDCLNSGCVPSKALISQAQKHKTTSQDWASTIAKVRSSIASIEPHDSVERYTELGVDVMQGSAQLLSPWQVKVGDREISARKIVIASGAAPTVPPIPGLSDISYLTSETVWQLDSLPEHLLVVGAGAIGCELAQAFAQLGSQVSLVDIADQIMPHIDQDAAEIVQKSLVDTGVDLRLNSGIQKFAKSAKGVEVTLSSEETITATQVLLCIGRTPRTSGFGLAELGVELGPRSEIKVNDYMQSNIPNIYAVGDVAGRGQLTHLAAHQAWYATVNALLFKRFKLDTRVIPAIVFTSIQVGTCGLSQKQADSSEIAYELTKFNLSELDRAIIDDDTEGFIKVLTVPGSQRILGVTVVSRNAEAILPEFALAMRHKLGLDKILATVHPYPTMAEAARYTATEWRRQRVPQWLVAISQRWFQLWR